MDTKRVDSLERKVLRGKPLPVPEKERWWRRYLEKTLNASELVSLAEAIVAETEGDGATPEQSQQAGAVWSLLWDRATGADLAAMVRVFGPRAGWEQLLAAD